MQNIDALEFANILATELWCQQLANFEGLNSGVPTRTTATITPTQLRSFEQTYIELGNCPADQTNHAGFVPPSITHANNFGILSTVGYCDSGPTTALHVSPGPLSASGDSSSSPGLPAPRRRNMGGRRPTKSPIDATPEEEERRRMRRERNKLAAARCRKRRLDQTNELQCETEQLEAKRHTLQEELRKLNCDKEKLEAIFQSHLPVCRLAKRSTSPPDVKPFHDTYPYPEDDVRVKVEMVDPTVETINVDPVLSIGRDIFSTPAATNVMLSSANVAVVTTTPSGLLQTPPATSRPNRPSYLQVPLTLTPAQMHKASSKVAGIEITTPTNGMPFNFDSLMEGGTGLTPVLTHPCGAHQQRQLLLTPDVPSPDTHSNTNLVSL